MRRRCRSGGCAERAANMGVWPCYASRVDQRGHVVLDDVACVWPCYASRVGKQGGSNNRWGRGGKPEEEKVSRGINPNIVRVDSLEDHLRQLEEEDKRRQESECVALLCESRRGGVSRRIRSFRPP